MRASIAIVGAGFAGAATAWHLARRGVRDILIVEAAAAPGAHASGRNAAVVRRLVEDDALIEAAVAGSDFIARPPEGFADRPLLANPGSLLLCGEATAREVAPRAARVGAERIGRADAERLAAGLAGADFQAALRTPGDGIADIRGLLDAFLRGAAERGARLLCATRALSLDVRAGRVAGLETTRGRIEAERVLDAAGAWAGRLARGAGARGASLESRRRHIVLANDPERGAPAANPFVWDIDHGIYFRPYEGGRTLLSACDQDVAAPNEDPAAEDAVAADPRAPEWVEAKLRAHLPALAGIRVERAWACLRTFSPDGRYIVGEDPEVGGLFYAAGLGGHGVTTAAAFGKIAAAAIVDGAAAVPAMFRMERFTRAVF